MLLSSQRTAYPSSGISSSSRPPTGLHAHTGEAVSAVAAVANAAAVGRAGRSKVAVVKSRGGSALY